MSSIVTMKGVRDVPIASAREDELKLDRYAKALADFVQQCDTPMTVGIQGDWGSGKTSLMQLIGALLRDRRGPDTFTLNTWQYAQVADSSHLSLVVVQALYGKLTQEPGAVQQAFDGLWKAFRSMKKLEFAGFGVEIGSEDAPDKVIPVDVEKVKNDFARLVETRLAKSGHDRVVVFVDDLDRVLPERAVDILEALKNFVDVPGCVFVIACDYAVVRKGLVAKFHVGESELDGRSFFDKIIQVPFRMPVHGYDVNGYVGQMLRRIGWSLEGDDLEKYYVPLLAHSVGFNPRSIKRLCNTLLLIKAVASGDQDEGLRTLLNDGARLKILFGLVCLESQYETAHAALCRDASHVASVLLDPDGATPDEVTRKLSPEAKARLLGLLKLLGSVVDANEDGNIDLVEQERLASMMRLSAITSVGGSEQPARSPRRTADELLELAGRSGILALVEPLRTTLVQRIEAGKRFKEMPSRATLSYYAPRQLWHEKGGSGSILMLGMTPTDGILRVQLCMTRLSQANAPQSRAWANLQAYLADHPADQSLRWDANWTLIELKTPDQVEDFLGVLTEVVPFA